MYGVYIYILTCIMPGTRCNVASCNNSAIKTKGLKIMYHSFPEDPTLRKEWINCCRRAGKWNPDSCRICSIHFMAEDYERDLQNELLGLPARKKLKVTALPSLNLPLKMPISSSAICRLSRANMRERKQLLKIILNEANKSSISENIPEAVPTLELTRINLQLPASELTLRKHRRLMENYKKLKNKFERIKITSKRKIKSLESMVRYYKLRCLFFENKCLGQN